MGDIPKKRAAESATRRPGAKGEGITARRKVSDRVTKDLNKPLELFGEEIDKQKDKIAEARREVDSQLEDLLTVDRDIPRIKAGLSSIRITLDSPIKAFDKRWTALRMKYLFPEEGKSVTQGDSEQYVQALKALIAEIDQYSKNVAAYIKELREGAGGYVTEAVLMRLETEGPKFVEALKGDKEMQEAMTSILNRFTDKQAPDVYQKVTNQMDKVGFKSENLATLWMAVSMMNVNEKVAFANFYLKKHPEVTPKAFVLQANKFGAMGTLEARQLLDYEKLSKDEKRNIRIKYEAINNYTKEARAIYRHSIGAENPANRMMTLKNVGFLFAKFATAATVITNASVALFRGGYKNPGMILKNPVILAAAGGYVGLKAMESNEPFSKRFEGMESRKNNQNLESLTDLREGLQGTIGDGWGGPKGFFMLYPDVFGEFVKKAKGKNDDIPKNKMTRENFLEFISKKHGEKSSEYKAFKEMADQKGVNTTQDSIYHFAQVFDHLEIGGVRSHAQQTYEEKKLKALSLR